MSRIALVLITISLLLLLGEALERHPPAWLHEDPLLHPGGWNLPAREPEAETIPPVEFPIDPNLADGPTLEALPGVGPVLAGRILEYRQTHGPFQKLQDLRPIRGVGPARLASWDSLLVWKGVLGPGGQ